jgi:hypothetical protein
VQTGAKDQAEELFHKLQLGFGQIFGDLRTSRVLQAAGADETPVGKTEQNSNPATFPRSDP